MLENHQGHSMSAIFVIFLPIGHEPTQRNLSIIRLQDPSPDMRLLTLCHSRARAEEIIAEETPLGYRAFIAP